MAINGGCCYLVVDYKGGVCRKALFARDFYVTIFRYGDRNVFEVFRLGLLVLL